jgi:selenocysteine lyase/cysteine desulfurase
MQILNQSSAFNLEKEKTYLNCAAYSPLLNSVVEEGYKSVQLKSRPYQIVPSVHFFDQVNEVRTLLSLLINENDANSIAMIPSASYGMAIVAANLHRWPKIEEKKKIFIIDEEFPNDVYAFQRVALDLQIDVVTLKYTERYNEYILEQLNEDIAMIVLPHVHWITGYKFDLQAIGQKCRANGIMMVIDGTQSIGAVPFNVQEIQPDALICATYKWLLGPYGQGFVYLSPFFDEGIPVEESWINRVESDNFAGLLAYKTEYRPKAQRYNVGEYSQFIQIPMLKVALQQILQWGVEHIQQYCYSITEEVIQKLMESGISLASEKERVNHLFSLKFIEEDVAKKVYHALQQEEVYVSLRGKCIRVSPYVYNTKSDLKKLASVVSQNI